MCKHGCLKGMSVAQTYTKGTKWLFCKSGHWGQQLAQVLQGECWKWGQILQIQDLLCVLSVFQKCKIPASSQGMQVGGLRADPGTGSAPGAWRVLSWDGPCPLSVLGTLHGWLWPHHQLLYNCPVKINLKTATAQVLSWNGFIHFSFTAQALKGLLACIQVVGING